MQCPQCDNPIEGNPKFCPECGAALAQDNQNQVEGASPSSPGASAEEHTDSYAPPAGSPIPEQPAPYQAPDPAQDAPAKQPWYGKTWVIVLFLLFLWPVGLVLMWMRSCAWKKTAKIIVTIVIALCAAWGIVNTVTLCNAYTVTPGPGVPGSVATDPHVQPDDQAKSAGADDTDDDESADGEAVDGIAGKGSSKKGSSSSNTTKKVGKAVDMGDCWDGNIPTLYGLANLTGDELAGMLEGRGFKFTKDENQYTYGKLSSGGANVRFADGDAPYAPSYVKHLDSLGMNKDPLEISLFESKAPDAMAKAGNLDFEKSKVTTDNGLFIGIAKDAFDNDILCLGIATSKGYTKFMLVNDAYVAGGYLDSLLDSSKTPSSISAFWDQYMKENKTGWK